MNKLLIIYGCALLSSAAVANDQQSTHAVVETQTEQLSTFENNVTLLQIGSDLDGATSNTYYMLNEGAFELNLNEIEFLEEDVEVDLGFDTADYLPSDFNPYETYFDLNSIIYIEEETELQLDFDSNTYLPVGFDPYSEIVDVHSINYMEEEDLDLGFDTKDYLPVGFTAYEAYVDLNAIPYMETEIELELDNGFEHTLPEGFDPYTDVLEVTSINYMEEENMELGFDTAVYLPENFDPYTRVD